MRLDQLEERMGHTISIEWKAFLLRAEPKATDHVRFVEYTRSWQRPAALEPAATFRVWATDNAQPSSSVPPQVAAKAVRRIAPDAAPRFHRRLLEAYFGENRTISDWSVLQDLAEDAGLDRADLAAEIGQNRHHLTRAVLADHNEAISNGINAVPTTVIAGVLTVPGAQDVDTLETWTTRLAQRHDREAPRTGT